MQSTQTSKQANGYKIAPVNSTADGLKLLEQLQKDKNRIRIFGMYERIVLYCCTTRATG